MAFALNHFEGSQVGFDIKPNRIRYSESIHFQIQ